jgi:hypothetical protein
MEHELWTVAKKKLPDGWLSVSPTGLSDFLECRRCGYRNTHGHKWPRVKYPTMPQGMDHALKRLSDHYRLSGKLPPLWGNLLPGRRLFGEAPRKLKWACEELQLNVNGEPDELLLEEDGTLAIADFKTKGFPVKEIYESYKMQMCFYALLAQKNRDYPKVSKTAYLICFNPDLVGIDVGFNVEVVPVDARPARALEFLRECEPYLRGSSVPPSSPECELCEYLDGLPPRLAAQGGWTRQG